MIDDFIGRSGGKLFCLTIALFAQFSFAMDKPEYSPTIEDLFHAGYLDDWESDFSAYEYRALISGIKLNIANQSDAALREFFSVAQKGSSTAMFHIGKILYDRGITAPAKDWLCLAALTHFQKLGKRSDAIHNLLGKLGISMKELKDELNFDQVVFNANPQIQLKPGQRWDPRIAQLNEMLERVQSTMQALKPMFSQAQPGHHTKLMAQTYRYNAVRKELNHWFNDSQASVQRALAFIMLCNAPTNIYLNVAGELKERSALPPLETSLLIERLLRKAKNNYRVDEMVVSIEIIDGVFEPELETIIGLLYANDPEGLFSITDRYAEIERRCDELNTPYAWEWKGFLLKEGLLQTTVEKLERARLAHYWLEKAGTTSALHIMGEMYFKGELGGDLSPLERAEIALGYCQKCENETGKRNTLSLLGILHRNREFADYATYLLTTDFSDKGFLYLSLARVNVLFWDASLKQGNADEAILEQILANAQLATNFGYGELAQPLYSFAESQKIMIVMPTLDITKEEKSIAEASFESAEIVREEKGEGVVCPNEDVSKIERLKNTDELSQEPKSPNTKRARKMAKKERRSKKFAQEVRENFHSDWNHVQRRPLKIRYINDGIRTDFEDMKRTYKTKINELLEDITINPSGIYGSGQPEILKNYGKFGGLISRHITQEHRLVYDFLGDETILIYSCVGHYK